MSGAGSSPRLAVLVPSIGIVHARPFYALASAISTGACWWRKTFGWDAGFHIYMAERQPLAQARNNLSAAAVKHGADWLLWLDDDVDVPANVLERLWPTAQATGVASVALNMKMKGHGVLAYLFEEGTSKRLLLPKWEGVIEVDGVGMGCVLMRGDVLRKVYDMRNCKPFHYADGKFQTEELAMFEDLKALGHRVRLDCDIPTKHYGLFGYQKPPPQDHMVTSEEAGAVVTPMV